VQQTQWAPQTGGIVGCAVAGAVLAVVAVVAAMDPPGRILVGVAALGLIVFATVSWRTRPKLAIATDGLLVRGWRRAHLLRRTDIKTIRITEFRRIGRRVRLLEIETTDDRLLVLSRWDLGVEPLDVLDALTGAGYAGPPG
jgi:hypothetical protein